MRSHSYFSPYLNVVAHLPLIFSAGFFSRSLSQTSSLASYGFCYRCLSRGNAVYAFPNPADSGKASACINAVSRERFAPLDGGTDAVTPTYMLATAGDLHPTYAMRTFMAVPSIWWLAPPPTRKECNVYRLSSIRCPQKWVWRFEVICAGVSAKFPFSPRSRTLGNKKPAPSASDLCMDAAACWYSIMAATAQISRQLAFLLTTSAWEDSRNVFPKRKLKMNPSF